MKALTRLLCLVAFLGTAAGMVSAGEERRVSFTTDVQPILTKLGCNQGACHGAQYGKGGFQAFTSGLRRCGGPPRDRAGCLWAASRIA